MRFTYPYETEPDADVMVVSFPDVPEALTQFGPNEDSAYITHDCLIAALRGYVEDRLPIPGPSPIVGRPFVTWMRWNQPNWHWRRPCSMKRCQTWHWPGAWV